MEITASNNKSKKRKFCREEDDDEEAKMETFFALVRNIRETRDQWINLRSASEKSVKEENRVIEVWKPTFQVEDFAEEKANQCRNQEAKPSLLLNGASHSNNNGSAKKEDSDKGINLKLSLALT